MGLDICACVRPHDYCSNVRRNAIRRTLPDDRTELLVALLSLSTYVVK
jgi:hypothetical protein